MLSPLRRSGNWADDMYILRKEYSRSAENENHLHRSIWFNFFSEYLNDCFHFEGNARETCQLTVVWFPQEFPVTTQKLHEFKSKWTKVYSLSHLSLVKFKQEYSIMLRNSQRRSVRPPAIAEQQNLWGKS